MGRVALKEDEVVDKATLNPSDVPLTDHPFIPHNIIFPVFSSHLSYYLVDYFGSTSKILASSLAS